MVGDCAPNYSEMRTQKLLTQDNKRAFKLFIFQDVSPAGVKNCKISDLMVPFFSSKLASTHETFAHPACAATASFAAVASLCARPKCPKYEGRVIFTQQGHIRGAKTPLRPFVLPAVLNTFTYCHE